VTWLPVETSGNSDRDAVLGLFPDAYAKHRAFLETCDATFDPGLLRVCKARIAQLLKSREELANYDQAWLESLGHWYENSAFSQVEQDALAFVEQYILDPSLITAELAGALEKALGTREVIDFATVIASFEASIRLSALFDLEPTP
jgi:alkylhydroperoxidase family enzyme